MLCEKAGCSLVASSTHWSVTWYASTVATPSMFVSLWSTGRAWLGLGLGIGVRVRVGVGVGVRVRVPVPVRVRVRVRVRVWVRVRVRANP